MSFVLVACKDKPLESEIVLRCEGKSIAYSKERVKEGRELVQVIDAPWTGLSFPCHQCNMQSQV